MLLSELKNLLEKYSKHFFRIQLPSGNRIPLCFHITEIGYVQKTFFDCGGIKRETSCCQLQVWVGEDYQHRIETEKMAAILEKGSCLFPSETLPVEIEYEEKLISQYTIQTHLVSHEEVILVLAHKHTECLAPELCSIPSFSRLPALGAKASCCPPGSC